MTTARAEAGAGRGHRTGEHLEIPVGDLVFDALAAGPADGELVLLLHGFPQSADEWRSQLQALGEAGYRAVAPDQRGYSRRARPEGTEHYRADHLAADVLAIADRLGGPTAPGGGGAPPRRGGGDGAPPGKGHRFHVVGHDWGALVAWQLAGRHPERLRSLTAVSVPHPLAMAEAMASPSGDQLARSSYMKLFQTAEVPERLLLADEGAGLRALFANTDFHHQAAIERYVALLSEPGALTAALNWYRAIDPAVLLGLQPVVAPTLFVWSTDDPAIGREAADACEKHVTGPYCCAVLEGVSHWIPENAPEALNRLLLDHLAGATT